MNYLVEHGIEAERLTPVGYGKDRPKKVRAKLAKKYSWLKEGDELTEDFIKAIDNEERQEICNSINRRTEFTVLRTTYGMFDENGKLKIQSKPANKEQQDTDEDYEFYY